MRAERFFFLVISLMKYVLQTKDSLYSVPTQFIFQWFYLRNFVPRPVKLISLSAKWKYGNGH